MTGRTLQSSTCLAVSVGTWCYHGTERRNETKVAELAKKWLLEWEYIMFEKRFVSTRSSPFPEAKPESRVVRKALN